MLLDGSSTSTLGRLHIAPKRNESVHRHISKNEELLQKSKFHLLRSCEQKLKIEEERQKAITNHMKRQSIRGVNELEEFSPSMMSFESFSPSLPSIREQVKANKEAKNFVRYIEGGGVELISPNSRGKVRIKNCKIPVSTSDLRLEELKLIDQTIKNLNELPDFGYDDGNFVTEDE